MILGQIPNNLYSGLNTNNNSIIVQDEGPIFQNVLASNEERLPNFNSNSQVEADDMDGSERKPQEESKDLGLMLAQTSDDKKLSTGEKLKQSKNNESQAFDKAVGDSQQFLNESSID